MAILTIPDGLLPEGFELQGDFRAPLIGEWFIDTMTGHATQANNHYHYDRIILQKIKRTSHIFEETGEFRRVRLGEYFIDIDGDVIKWRRGNITVNKHKILRKITETI